MSSLVGTGNNFWAGTYVVLSTLGFVALFGLVEVYYIKRFGIIAWWYRGLLFTLCMIAGVVFVGGIVVFLWHRSEKRNSSYENLAVDDNKKSNLSMCKEATLVDETSKANLASFQTTRYGCRPDFQGKVHGRITMLKRFRKHDNDY